MAERPMPHDNHENHLCYLDNIGYVQSMPDAYKELVRNGRFWCRACGRVAGDRANLCAAEKL
jgi:hypothetical protein